MVRTWVAMAAMLGLSACATPYQEMTFWNGAGVKATQISGDTFQITGRGNAYTDADTIQRYTLRKAAEVTIAAGYDLFTIGGRDNRSSASTFSTANASAANGTAWGWGNSWTMVQPGETIIVRMSKYPAPSPLPMGMFDARETAKFLAEADAKK